MTDDKTVYDGSEYGSGSEDTVYESYDTVAAAVTTDFSATGGLRKGGMLLDTYRVESDAVKGGMGAVWRVHHRDWDVDLAMKRPKEGFFTTEHQKADFIHECDAWINLGLHPNIVSCYYVREIQGVPTIFSEWMEGGSLKDRIEDETLYDGTKEEVQKRLMDIAIQFARGLDYAHENGIIHQDVKPDNLLLTKEWDAKVSDFGLARAESGGRTPAYCSPEQAESRTLTRRTDIYSWAVSVLEMYLGDKPWAHEREMTGPMVGAVCNDYFGMCRVKMPERLQRLLARCLAADPEDRYRDFGKVEVALKEIYRMETGEEYPRPKPQAAVDHADSLNNRALSLLDLGKTDEALQLWDQALRSDDSNFRCHYNRAVALWKNNRMKAEELCKCVEDREEDSEDWKKAHEAVQFAKVRTQSEVEWPLMQMFLDEDPFHQTMTMDDKRRVAEKAGIPVVDQPFHEVRWEKYDLQSLRPVDVAGDIVASYGPVIELVQAMTGRSLMTIHPKTDYDGDEIFQKVRRFSETGYIYVSGVNEADGDWYLLPPADPKVDHILSRIESFDDRSDALERLVSVYPKAEELFEDEEYEQVLELLSPAAEDGTLFLYEPALELWERLFDYCEKGKLIRVIPSDTLHRPVATDPRAEDRSLHVTLNVVETYTMSENYNNGMDFDFIYSLRATSKLNGAHLFTVDRLITDSQSDDRQIEYGLNLELRGSQLRMQKEHWGKAYCVDLEDPEFQRTHGMAITLPGFRCTVDPDEADPGEDEEYFLRNTEEGVQIGDFTFEDEYRGLGPLWNQRVVQCRDRAYRLIYRYTRVDWWD